MAVSLRGPAAVSETLVFAVGRDGAAVGSNDGGETFSTMKTGTDRDLRDCSFVDDKTGYAVGQSGTVLRFAREW